MHTKRKLISNENLKQPRAKTMDITKFIISAFAKRQTDKKVVTVIPIIKKI